MIDTKSFRHWEYVHKQLPGEAYFTENFHDKAGYHKLLKEYPYIRILVHHEVVLKPIHEFDKHIVSSYEEAEEYILHHVSALGRNYKKWEVVGANVVFTSLGYQLQLFTTVHSFYSTSDGNHTFFHLPDIIKYVKHNKNNNTLISLELDRSDV